MINCQKLTKGERQWKIRVIRKRRRRSIRIEKKQEMMPDFLPGDVNKKSKKKAKKLKNERLRILSQLESAETDHIRSLLHYEGLDTVGSLIYRFPREISLQQFRIKRA